MGKRNTKSIITVLTQKCFLCGSRKNIETHHIIYDFGNTKLSARYGLTVPLCKSCHEKVHSDREIDLKLKRLAQVAFQNEYPDEDFAQVFGEYYLLE